MFSDGFLDAYRDFSLLIDADVLRRGCHRSAVGVVNLMTGSRDLSKFRVSSPKQPGLVAEVKFMLTFLFC